MPKYLIFSVFVLQIKIFDCQTKIFAMTVTSYQHYDVKIAEIWLLWVTGYNLQRCWSDPYLVTSMLICDKIDMLVTNFHQYAKM